VLRSTSGDSFASSGRCCSKYFGTLTFREAYLRTGRTVNINVSQSTLGGGPNARRVALLLNHLTAPHVLIASAVHASCCLPTVLKPAELLKKDPQTGAIEPFLPATDPSSRACWIDGSFTADVPRKRMAELFNVTQLIVSQTNPHVAAANQHEGAAFGYIRRQQNVICHDMLSRLWKLSKLNLLPRLYATDIKGLALHNTYTGNVTIWPDVGFPFILPAMVRNPKPPEMERYLQKGRLATFPKMSQIEHLLAIERALRDGLMRLNTNSPAKLTPASSLHIISSLHHASRTSLSRPPSMDSLTALSRPASIDPLDRVEADGIGERRSRADPGAMTPVDSMQNDLLAQLTTERRVLKEQLALEKARNAKLEETLKHLQNVIAQSLRGS